MTTASPDDRDRALRDAAREYGRLLVLDQRNSREQVERKHAALLPELSARLDEVEELLGGPQRPMTLLGAAAAAQRRQLVGYECRSKQELFGWPLVHIVSGIDPVTGRARVARGVIAIGGAAVGGFAMGGMSLGIVSVGGMSLGLLSIGGMAAGGLAIGGMAAGIVAFGGLAVGIVAAGGFAAGHFAAGGHAVGTHRLSGRVRDPAAVQLFTALRDSLRALIGR